jgi:hypothetical protein
VGLSERFAIFSLKATLRQEAARSLKEPASLRLFADSWAAGTYAR